MDIKIVDQNGVEEERKPQEFPTPQGFDTTNIMRTEVAQLFDFRPSEITQNKNKIDTLIQYAQTQTKDHSPEGIKWAIRRLSTKLGAPPLLEKPLEYMYRYAFLCLQGNRIEAEKKRFINGRR